MVKLTSGVGGIASQITIILNNVERRTVSLLFSSIVCLTL